MSGLLVLTGLLALLLCLVGLAKGSVRSLRLTTRGQCAKGAAVALAAVVLGGALVPEPSPPRDVVAQEDGAPAEPSAAASPEAAPAQAVDGATPATPTAEPAPEPTAEPALLPTAPPAVAAPAERVRAGSAAAPLLVMASGGDGDSWRDTSGVEYRMGLVNAPETQECGGAAATAYRKRALAGGFRAEVYARDGHGRKVAVVETADGRNLNVAMARDGIVDDRFLARFRHENPALAAQLDGAFREARAAGRGIWGACSPSGAGARTTAPAAEPVAPGRCHPDYATCIPVAGDGSGRGAANDLDCGQVDGPVRLRRIGTDPYRLDGSDQDGVGCE